MPVSADHFRTALSRLAAGVSVISTASGSERRGITATAVCSLSAIPPRLLVCVNTATGTCKMIEEAGWFAVNLLGEDQLSLAEVFAGRGGIQGNERFEHGTWSSGDRGGQPLLEGALAALECRVDQIVQSGTHAIFIGVVEATIYAEARPLIYQAGQFHKLPVEVAAAAQ
jgi:flavin reductase (DIM6/NTAB) family NADH-FMN oxidoreductase RutF